MAQLLADMGLDWWPGLAAVLTIAYTILTVLGAVFRQARHLPDIEPPPDVSNCENCGAPAVAPVCGYCGTKH